MVRGEACGSLVRVLMVLFASGNYQVWNGVTTTVRATFSQRLSDLIVPPPPVTEEQKTTTAEGVTRGSGELLGLTEEEERELAELMDDDI